MMNLANGFIEVADALLVEFPSMDLQMEEDGRDRFMISFVGCVLPGYGLGTRFMERLLALADQCSVALAVVPARQNPRLIGWYTRLGFITQKNGTMVRMVDVRVIA